MADEKKPEAKDSKPAGSNTDPLIEIFIFFLGLFIILSIIGGLFNSIRSSSLFSLGWRAPTERNIWLSMTKPISSLLNPIGEKFVVINKSVSLYDSPGGSQIGKIKLGDKGTIIGGPVTIYGEKYWQVRMEDGTVGWVSENDIAYLENDDPGFIMGTLLLFWKLVYYIKYIIFFLSIILLICIVYLSRRLTKIRVNERARLYPGGYIKSNSSVPEVPKNQNWERILKYMDSPNESDWRLAVLEADIILSDLLENMGLPGETMGDKLKAVEKSDFTTLDNAWEAHKVRNSIAHDGQDFVLTNHEAKRVIGLYRTVFEEFKIV